MNLRLYQTWVKINRNFELFVTKILHELAFTKNNFELKITGGRFIRW